MRQNQGVAVEVVAYNLLEEEGKEQIDEVDEHLFYHDPASLNDYYDIARLPVDVHQSYSS